MHLFEAILIVLAGQLALAVAVLGGRGPKWANLLPLVLLAPLGAHLTLEEARWQMIPAYAVVIGFCLAGTIRYRRKTHVPAHAALRALGISGFVLLLLSVVAVASFR